MPIDRSIFGLRFGSNAELQPTQEELRAFLASPKKAGKREPHGIDLASYQEMLNKIEAFERGRRVDPASQDFRERMFFGTLSRTSFFNASLKTAIEQYKYQLHTLLSLDFRKPTAFIKSAEEEIEDLNPKNTNEAAKIARLQGMIEERKRTLDTLAKRWGALAGELRNIAGYVADNLVKIERLCEGSIVILVDLQIAGNEANRLIEDIKEHFKELLKDSLHQGQVTKGQVETAKQDVVALSEELSSLIKEDVYSLTGLLEAVHDHAKKIAGDIAALTARIEGATGAGVEEGGSLFEEMERVLISLVSDYHFELRAAAIRTATSHEDILVEKRKEMLDRLLEVLQKERRARSDRRSDDRRKFRDPDYKGPERRQKERRLGKNRR